jgi:hypothetical protein
MENLENEIWLPIPVYELLYEVSNIGRVRSLPREWTIGNGGIRKHNGRILKPNISGCGYLKLNLYKDSKRKTIKVHQLVAMVFLGHIPDGYKIVVDHINENKLDNRVENLQLISNRKNAFRVKNNKGYSSNYKGVSLNKKTNKWVSNIVINNTQVSLGYFSNEKEAAKSYEIAAKNLEKFNGDKKTFRELIKKYR